MMHFLFMNRTSVAILWSSEHFLLLSISLLCKTVYWFSCDIVDLIQGLNLQAGMRVRKNIMHIPIYPKLEDAETTVL